jgi:hypothetical protein
MFQKSSHKSSFIDFSIKSIKSCFVFKSSILFNSFSKIVSTDDEYLADKTK